MVYQLREEVKTAKKAAMGEMYQLAKENIMAGEKVINFASGHPAAEAFPDELIRRYMNQSAEDYCANSFQYEPAGYVPLRNALREFVDHDKRMIRQEDDVLVTYGSTEAVYLAAMAFVNPGDKVIVEEPSYVNAIKAFQYLGAEVVGVPMEKDGVSVEALDNILKMYGGGGISTLYNTKFCEPFGHHNVMPKAQGDI